MSQIKLANPKSSLFHNTPLMQYRKSEYLILFFLCLIGFIIRMSLLQATDFSIDSDEAIVGLMAKHILEGREWPIFYYGQAYMGSLEAFFAAISFYLFGISNFSLKLVPLCFSLVFIVSVYALARRYLGVLASSVAAFLCAFAPSAFVLWSTKARGGFIELLVLGTLSLIITADIYRSDKVELKKLFLLGLVLGLGWWTNNQIAFYMAAIGIFLLFYCLLKKELLKPLFVGLFGFLIGGLPFWYYNLFYSPQFASFKLLFGQKAPTQTGFVEHIQGYFGEALPIILGAKRFWSDIEVFPYLSLIAYLLYGLAFFLFLKGSFRKEKKHHLLLVVFLLVVPLIFSASSFGWLSKAPRYLLPLYSVLFILAGFLFEKAFVFNKVLAVLVFTAFCLINAASNYYPKQVIPGEPFVFKGQRVSRDHTELYEWLKSNNYRHINANYWIGYRTAFETKEEVTFSRFGSPRSFRIPEYEVPNPEFDEFAVYVLVPNEARLFIRMLSQTGYQFRISRVSNYLVIDDIRRGETELEQIPLSSIDSKASDSGEKLRYIFDGDLASRWGSGRPQNSGMFLDLVFKDNLEIAGFDLDLANFVHDAPRGLSVVANYAEDNACILFDTQLTKLSYDATNRNFGQIPSKWSIRFRPIAANQLRLLQTASDPVFDWSIAELEVYKVKKRKE